MSRSRRATISRTYGALFLHVAARRWAILGRRTAIRCTANCPIFLIPMRNWSSARTRPEPISISRALPGTPRPSTTISSGGRGPHSRRCDLARHFGRCREPRRQAAAVPLSRPHQFPAGRRRRSDRHRSATTAPMPPSGNLIWHWTKTKRSSPTTAPSPPIPLPTVR